MKSKYSQPVKSRKRCGLYWVMRFSFVTAMFLMGFERMGTTHPKTRSHIPETKVTINWYSQQQKISNFFPPFEISVPTVSWRRPNLTEFPDISQTNTGFTHNSTEIMTFPAVWCSEFSLNVSENFAGAVNSGWMNQFQKDVTQHTLSESIQNWILTEILILSSQSAVSYKDKLQNDHQQLWKREA